MSEDNKPQSDLHNAAKELGAAGGRKGGPARARKLSSAERSRIASLAAKARWSKAESKKRAVKKKLKGKGKKK